MRKIQAIVGDETYAAIVEKAKRATPDKALTKKRVACMAGALLQIYCEDRKHEGL